MVQGKGLRTSTTSKRSASNAVKAPPDQCCRCPGVLPSSDQYLPRATFRMRQSGSLGTLAIRCGRASCPEHVQRPRRIGQMLQNLAADDQLGRVAVRLEPIQVGDLEGDRRRRCRRCAGAPPQSSPATGRCRAPGSRRPPAAWRGSPRRSRPRAPGARRCAAPGARRFAWKLATSSRASGLRVVYLG